MRKSKLTIEIIKAKRELLWYKNKIGQKFIVFDEDSKKDTYSLKFEGHVSKIIYKDDAKILKRWDKEEVNDSNK